jgi:pimeloyl-ACP methyl ester carboxylesterase
VKTVLQERFLTLADGRRVALLESEPVPGEQTSKPLLVALHGWLDNSASFVPLAPYLTHFQLVCIDLPGHGHSDHKSTPYVFVDWLDDLYQIAQAAGWTAFTLLGHSLGALIASAYAGVFPEQVERLILLEGLGPLSQPDEAVPEQLRRAILNRSRTRERASQGFASIDEAVAARCKVADIGLGSARLIRLAERPEPLQQDESLHLLRENPGIGGGDQGPEGVAKQRECRPARRLGDLVEIVQPVDEDIGRALVIRVTVPRQIDADQLKVG